MRRLHLQRLKSALSSAAVRNLVRLWPRTAMAVALVAITGGIIFGANQHLTEAANNSHNGNHKVTAQQYKQVLKSQVDTDMGKPRTGRDPSTQKQTSLAEVASMAEAGGLRGVKPAAGVVGDTNHHVQPSDVYGDPDKTGINDAGCLVDYGIPGEQCVPAGMVDDMGMLMCDDVRTEFPKGVKVTGTDRFHVDANHDGIACDSGD